MEELIEKMMNSDVNIVYSNSDCHEIDDIYHVHPAMFWMLLHIISFCGIDTNTPFDEARGQNILGKLGQYHDSWRSVFLCH